MFATKSGITVEIWTGEVFPATIIPCSPLSWRSIFLNVDQTFDDAVVSTPGRETPQDMATIILDLLSRCDLIGFRLSTSLQDPCKTKPHEPRRVRSYVQGISLITTSIHGLVHHIDHATTGRTHVVGLPWCPKSQLTAATSYRPPPWQGSDSIYARGSWHFGWLHSGVFVVTSDPLASIPQWVLEEELHQYTSGHWLFTPTATSTSRYSQKRWLCVQTVLRASWI